MLVLAGAGTGKTTVLTGRIARLIAEGHAQPDEVLATTYTENAAEEMRTRLLDDWGVAPQIAARVRLSTFDAYCFGVLERARRSFRVLDDKDLWVYLRRRIADLRLQQFAVARDPAEFLNDLLEFFRRCHDELVTPEAFAAYVERLTPSGPLPRVKMREKEETVPPEITLERLREIARVFGLVERMLADDGFGTFGHMIVRARALLSSDPALLAAERRRAKFILIDEFQDSNAAQIELAQLLAGDERNVFAVGDPDQAIYRFRGASTAAFQRFLRLFPDTRQVQLEKNRRSTTPILQCSAAMIGFNPEPAGADSLFRRKTLESARAEEAAAEGLPFPQPSVELVMTPNSGVKDLDTEAVEVARLIQEARTRESLPWSSFAVLYRAHRQRERVVAELFTRGIPFEVRGVDALDTPEVRDLVALLRVVVRAGDGEALLRVAALPRFSLDSRDVRDRLEAAGRSVDVREVLAQVHGGGVVLSEVEQARREAAGPGMRLVAATLQLVRRFRLDKASPPVRAFLDFATAWESKPIVRTPEVGEFLEYLHWFRRAGGSIAMDEASSSDPGPDGRVRLMTVHAAKGLEFDRVFVLRANSNSFPARYREPLFEFPQGLRREGSLAEQDSRDIHKQEERRLFYVAMTRARDRLVICARPGRGRDPRPDGYLRDFMDAVSARPYWQQRAATPTIDVAAAAVPPAVGVGAWLSAPPRASLAGIPLSATSIDSYEQCPLQFKIDKEWSLPGKPAAQLQFGNAVHTALKAFYDAVLAGRPLSLPALLRTFDEALAAMPADDPHQRELYLEAGHEQLEEFFRRAAAAPSPDVLGTERAFRMKLGGAFVTGRVDRIDRLGGGRVEIVDYKTGKPRTQDNADDSLQLSIYALAAREWGFEPAKLTIYNLESNEPVTTSRTAAQLAAAEDRIAAVATRIAQGDFEPTPGFHCAGCDYRDLCPATEQRLYSIRGVGAGVI